MIFDNSCILMHPLKQEDYGAVEVLRNGVSYILCKGKAIFIQAHLYQCIVTCVAEGLHLYGTAKSVQPGYIDSFILLFTHLSAHNHSKLNPSNTEDPGPC